MFINVNRWRRPGACIVVALFIGLQIVSCGLPAPTPPPLPVLVAFITYQVICLILRR